MAQFMLSECSKAPGIQNARVWPGNGLGGADRLQRDGVHSAGSAFGSRALSASSGYKHLGQENFGWSK